MDLLFLLTSMVWFTAKIRPMGSLTCSIVACENSAFYHYTLPICSRKLVSLLCSQVWDPFIGMCVHQFDSGKNTAATVLTSLPAPSTCLVTATTDTTLRFLDVRTHIPMHEFKCTTTPAGKTEPCYGITDTEFHDRNGRRRISKRWTFTFTALSCASFWKCWVAMVLLWLYMHILTR